MRYPTQPFDLTIFSEFRTKFSDRFHTFKKSANNARPKVSDRFQVGYNIGFGYVLFLKKRLALVSSIYMANPECRLFIGRKAKK